MRNEWDELQHHKQKLEWRVQHAAHQAQHHWRRWHTELRRSRGAHALRLHASLFTVSDDCLTYTHASSSERIHTSICVVIHGALSLTRFSLSTSSSSSCLSPSSSSTSSCSLSSTTRSSWQTCAAPWTPSPLSQVMSPTSWPSASSTTHQSPSPSWSHPRTRTWMTWHSARCSQRHTEDKSTTTYQEACQSVSRRRL